MAVIITDLCINCDACIDECPATAIESSSASGREFTYVKPEKCIECVDATSPKCADACPTEGAIAWDMPYTEEYIEYFKSGHESGKYTIRVHKSKGIMLPNISPKPFRDNIPMAYRTEHKDVNVEEMNSLLLDKMAK